MRGKKVPRKRKRRGETCIMIEFGDNLSLTTYLIAIWFLVFLKNLLLVESHFKFEGLYKS
jgi:hypothetical protein